MLALSKLMLALYLALGGSDTSSLRYRHSWCQPLRQWCTKFRMDHRRHRQDSSVNSKACWHSMCMGSAQHKRLGALGIASGRSRHSLSQHWHPECTMSHMGHGQGRRFSYQHSRFCSGRVQTGRGSLLGNSDAAGKFSSCYRRTSSRHLDQECTMTHMNRAQHQHPSGRRSRSFHHGMLSQMHRETQGWLHMLPGAQGITSSCYSRILCRH